MARFLRRFLGTAAASEGQAAPAAAAAVAAAADSAPCKDIDWSKGKVYHYKVLPRTYRLTEVSPEKRAKACGLKHQLEKVIFKYVYSTLALLFTVHLVQPWRAPAQAPGHRPARVHAVPGEDCAAGRCRPFQVLKVCQALGGRASVCNRP